MEQNYEDKQNCQKGNCDRKQNKENFDRPNRGMVRHSKHYDVFDPFFDGFFGFPHFKDEFRELDKIMKTDVREEENGYTLEVELPGVKKGDVSLDLNNGYLTIEAKQTSSDDEKDSKGNYIRRERYYGTSARSFYVGDIDEADIDASLDSGILKVYIPKEKKEDQKKHIEIK